MTSVIAFCAILLTHSMWRAGLHEYFFKVAALSCALALAVWFTRAGTVGAALTGALVAASIAMGTAAPSRNILFHSAIPGLLALFLLTTAATRFRRADKINLGLAESSSRRTAAQVVANLGTAAVFAAMAGQTENYAFHPAMLAGVVAALAEATADTLASELGETFPGPVVMITTWRSVPPGTDGGITAKGTAAGLIGASFVVLVCALAIQFSLHTAVAALLAATAGLFIDSLLGATLETRGYIGNDAVNFISTLASAFIAAALMLI
jgi:uncharacterized protein (TIGR00297 family)